jgi:hypothetical protein
MQVTVDIPDTLADRLRSVGLDPAAAAQQLLSPKAYQRLLYQTALTAPREAVLQGGLNVAAGRTRPSRESLAGMRRKHATPV